MAKVTRKNTRASARKNPLAQSEKKYGEKGRNWIQGMHMKKGALHSALDVPAEQPIAKSKLRAATKKRGKLGRRARLALVLLKLGKRR